MTRCGPPPDAFAVVMATGILAVAADVHHYRPLALALLAIASAAFAVLLGWLATAVPGRLPTLRREARSPDVALRAFSFVAGSTVLAAALQQLLQGPGWAVELLAAVALVAWLGLLPLAIQGAWRAGLRQLRDQVHGAWVLVSVGTSGLATVAADLAVRWRAPEVLVVGAALWVLDVLLYVLVLALVGRRLATVVLRPADVTPDSWVLMGGLAISTLTGNHVLAALARLDAPAGAVSAAHGVTVVLQVAAFVWVPLLLVAQVWGAGKAPDLLTYRGAWWAAAFPLGTLAVASAATARSWPLTSLTTVSLVVFWDALLLWTAVAVGLLHRATRQALAASR